MCKTVQRITNSAISANLSLEDIEKKMNQMSLSAPKRYQGSVTAKKTISPSKSPYGLVKIEDSLGDDLNTKTSVESCMNPSRLNLLTFFSNSYKPVISKCKVQMPFFKSDSVLMEFSTNQIVSDSNTSNQKDDIFPCAPSISSPEKKNQNSGDTSIIQQGFEIRPKPSIADKLKKLDEIPPSIKKNNELPSTNKVDEGMRESLERNFANHDKSVLSIQGSENKLNLYQNEFSGGLDLNGKENMSKTKKFEAISGSPAKFTKPDVSIFQTPIPKLDLKSQSISLDISNTAPGSSKKVAQPADADNPFLIPNNFNSPKTSNITIFKIPEKKNLEESKRSTLIHPYPVKSLENTQSNLPPVSSQKTTSLSPEIQQSQRSTPYDNNGNDNDSSISTEELVDEDDAASDLEDSGPLHDEEGPRLSSLSFKEDCSKLPTPQNWGNLLGKVFG